MQVPLRALWHRKWHGKEGVCKIICKQKPHKKGQREKGKKYRQEGERRENWQDTKREAVRKPHGVFLTLPSTLCSDFHKLELIRLTKCQTNGGLNCWLEVPHKRFNFFSRIWILVEFIWIWQFLYTFTALTECHWSSSAPNVMVWIHLGRETNC